MREDFTRREVNLTQSHKATKKMIESAYRITLVAPKTITCVWKVDTGWGYTYLCGGAYGRPILRGGGAGPFAGTALGAAANGGLDGDDRELFARGFAAGSDFENF